MEDDNSMSERILRTLETILDSDPELKEFSIVPTEDNTKNKSPVLFEEHTIGLESWCVKYIYQYAYMELFEVRQAVSRNKLAFCKETNLNHLLAGVLLINPDVSTFWNMKRELVQHEVLAVNKELHFTKIVLSYKYKSNEAFSYRRWLLNRLLSKILNDSNTVSNLLQNELDICEMAASKTPNNYHAWTHRIWCMENFVHRTANVANVISSELEFSYRWLSSHVSEHTGYHYRQYLFDTVKTNKHISNIFEIYYKQTCKDLGLVNESEPRSMLVYMLGKQKSLNRSMEEANKYVNYFCLLLFDLFNTVQTLNSVFPNHEAIWYHRRYLLYQLIKTCYQYHDLELKPNVQIDDSQMKGTNIVGYDAAVFKFSDGEKQPKLFKSQPNKVESSYIYHTIVKTEMEFIRQNSSGGVGYLENEHARRHEKWLKLVTCLEQV